ncbi:hypothetical protein DL89DRAFT_265500 [Linderina pennispora]|uniref:DUF4097 domain-containing protein n=1 Tax=Linderina pennispora TaxID=61395 RepID=A0A1Y1WEL8_9FUNG|nr:uncharacterized protein DL89DRAFT_265500 [Linderina pennispora]ORX71788.1 hypothetical protein DL89DRAFT_265500 [Linderina pennispora]
MQVHAADIRKGIKEEEFPVLNEAAALAGTSSQAAAPPPYSPFDPTDISFPDTQPSAPPVPPQQQAAAAISTVSANQNTSPSAPTSTTTQPASQGYQVVRIANGEGESLLPRVRSAQDASGDLRPLATDVHFHHQGQRRHSLQRRRVLHRGRGCLSRCCCQIFSCCCFLVGLAFIIVLFSIAVMIARQVFPPGGDWNCSNLMIQKNETFAFGLSRSLYIESVEGMSISTQAPIPLIVNVVAEAGKSNTRNKIAFVWPRDCVRITLNIAVPPHIGPAAMPLLHVVTSTGSAQALDLAAIPVKDLDIQIHNGPIQLRSLSVLRDIHVVSSNGRISINDVRAPGTSTVESSNGALVVDRTHTSNAVVRASHISGSKELTIRTANGNIALESIDLTTNAGAVDATVHTSNGNIEDIPSKAPGPAPKTIEASSSNSRVELTLSQIRGTFDVKTSNARAQVEGSDDVLKFERNSSSRKMGVYGRAKGGNVTVTSSNGQASLIFDDTLWDH